MIIVRSKLWKNLGVLCLLAVVACEPAELPTPKDDGPTFFSELSLDGSDAYWGSGKDGIYNFTFFEGLPNGVLRYSSVFQQDTCSSICPNSFRVDLYSLEEWRGSTVDPVRQFRPGMRNLERLNEVEIRWLLDAILTGIQQPFPGGKVQWTLNGVNIGENVAEVSKVLSDTSQSFELCATLFSDAGRAQQICHQLSTMQFKPMVVDLQGIADGSSNVKLTAKAQFGKPPYRYFWNGREGADVELFRPIQDTFRVTLRVLDAAGNQLRISNLADLKNPALFSLNAQIKLSVERKTEPVRPFARVALRYVDERGNEYHSARGPQAPSTFFEIEEVQLFKVEPGQKTQAKLKMKFSGSLFDMTGRQRDISGGKATMIFNYPG